MIFFRKTKSSAEKSVPPALPELERLRQQTKHRFIGAAVLLLLAVVVVPMIFDHGAVPSPASVAIEIPKPQLPAMTEPVANLPSPVPNAITAPAAAASAPNNPVVLSDSPSSSQVTAVNAAPLAARQLEIGLPAVSSPAVVLPSLSTAAAPGNTAANVSANTAAHAAGNASALPQRDPKGRFVVQAGAFFESERVREVRQTLQKVGLDSYTQVISTAEGKRTRIRIGPFSTREEATAVHQRIEPLGLEAAVLRI